MKARKLKNQLSRTVKRAFLWEMAGVPRLHGCAFTTNTLICYAPRPWVSTQRVDHTTKTWSLRGPRRLGKAIRAIITTPGGSGGIDTRKSGYWNYRVGSTE